MQLSLQFVIGLALTSAVALASEVNQGMSVPLERRVSFVKSDNQLDVKALAAHFKAVNNKYKTAMKNYKSNTGKDFPLLRMLLGDKRSSGTGSVELTDVEHEQLWTGKITVGGQSFQIDFDTGSADLIVNPGGYNPDKSKSAHNTGQHFRSSYADGTTSTGNIYQDEFQIAGLTAQKVPVGHSVKTFVENEQGNQGIAGLSFNSISSFPKQYSKSFFYALREQKAISQGVVQFNIKAGQGSQMYIGGQDQSKISGDVAWASVDPSKGFWSTEGQINGKKINAIVDTGSTIISAPTDQVRELFSSLHGVQAFQQEGSYFGAYDCNQNIKLTFTFANKQFTLPKKLTSFGQSNGKCVLPISGLDQIPMDAWIIGDVFFQTATVIFDADKNRIGFAEQNGN